MKLISETNSFIRSKVCVCLTYHSLSNIISTGLFPLSLTGISCSWSLIEDNLFSCSKISIAFFLASITDKPDRGPEISVISPFRLIATNGSKPNSLKTDTSF